MKRIGNLLVVAIFLAAMGSIAQAQLVQEHFLYSTGQLTSASGGANVSGGNWVTFSGTGNFIQVSSGSLSYPAYLGSTGNKIDIVATTASAEDAYRQFTTQTTGTIYVAFLINVANLTLVPTNASATGEYFAGFISSSSTTAFVGRIAIRQGVTAGTYQLGVGASTNATKAFASTEMLPGTTQLVVMSYQIIAGPTNDVVNLWVNPVLGGSEPAADATQVSTSDSADIARFFVRQGTAASLSSPNASIDGIRIGTAWTDVTSSPTAANGLVSGTIKDNEGRAVEGAVVSLGGTENRKTITDAKGSYRFDNVETNGFYNVSASRANYSFSPASRSFSILGNHTDAAFTGASTGDNANPLDTAEYFVRQQYVDILGREPDEGGFNYWSNEILSCGNDASCTDRRRREVAASFFVAEEFQDTGSFIYDMYKGSLGRKPVFNEYSTDRKQVVGGSTLTAQKAAFADSFVHRTEFMQKYQGQTTADSFVDALLQNVLQSSQLDLGSQRAGLITQYNSGGTLEQSRSLVLKSLADNAALKQKEYNAAFVLTEYFGYLRRNPEPEGYDFWLNVVTNGDVGNYRGMVCSFITSTEYQQRFSSVVTHSNAECGPVD